MIDGNDLRPMQIVREILQGEKISAIVNELKSLTFTLDVEHALVKLSDGRRMIVSGDRNGILLSENVTRLFAHSHPYSLPCTGPSHDDFRALLHLGRRQRGQKHSYILENGILTRYNR